MTTEITQYEGEFAVLGDGAQEYLDMLEENTGSREFSLSSIPTYVFPGSGDDRWVWEDATGEKHRLASIIGTVLGQRAQRTLFLSDFAGGGAPPDCQSQDGITGTPLTDDDGHSLNIATSVDNKEIVFGGACASCPFNQWESAALVGKKGAGKACREQRMLIVQRPEDPTPMRVRIPPTALLTWKSFGETLTNSRLRLSRALIELGLEVPRGKTVAELRTTLLAHLPEETSVALKALVPDVKRPMLAAPAEQPEETEPPF